MGHVQICHGGMKRGGAEMKRYRSLMKRAAVLAAAFIMVFTSVVITAAEGSFAATEDKKKTASNSKVRVVILDTTYDAVRVAKCMRKTGFKVTMTNNLKKASPAKYDALVIPGGADVNPKLYGAKRHWLTFGVDTAKDKRQIKAIKKFARAGKPVLGICRGCQVINVAYGGTLKQHIGRHSGFRYVRNVKGWWMYDMFGKYQSTYHSHHQAVGRLGKHIVATSYDSGSGYIEAIQHEKLPVYGIQWHPDMKTGRQGLKTFREFKKICLSNKAELSNDK